MHDGDGGSTDASQATATDAGTSTTTVEGCSWPAALAQAGSGSGQCNSAARRVLSCNISSDVTSICITSDTACDASNASVAVTCQNLCEATEFGVACGSIGPGVSQVAPPAGCRGVVYTPGGVAFYCCPCGM
jgi:hypothetical protein